MTSRGMRPLLNAADVARILQVSKPQAYVLMRSGKMATVRMGRNVRVTEEDLQVFIEGQREAPRQGWRERMKVVG